MRLASFALALLAAAGCAAVPPPCAPGLVYVGTESGGIHALRFDSCAGSLTALGEVAQAPKPRWLAAHPTLPVIYATTDGDGLPRESRQM